MAAIDEGTACCVARQHISTRSCLLTCTALPAASSLPPPPPSSPFTLHLHSPFPHPRRRALKTKHETPKYGLIYHASLIGQSGAKFKGKISRVLAAKCALAIRVDALGEGTDATIGIEARAKVGHGALLLLCLV
jgi:hypothetical protein